jgi:hypothetical protein
MQVRNLPEICVSGGMPDSFDWSIGKSTPPRVWGVGVEPPIRARPAGSAAAAAAVASAGQMGRSIPLLALAALLCGLAVRELLSPVPTLAIPPTPPPPTGGGGADTDDAEDDPFDPSEDEWKEEPGAPKVDLSMDLAEWLEEALGVDDGESVGFALSGEGFRTLGDLVDADMSEEDLTDLEIPSHGAQKLLNQLDTATGFKGGRRPTGSSGSTRAPKSAPVDPMKAALANGLRYVFYAGIGMLWFGDKLFGAVGIPEPAVRAAAASCPQPVFC